MDDVSAREVQGAKFEDPAAFSPDPVGHRRVYERDPEDHEEDVGAELHALGEGAGEYSRGDNREHALEHHEQEWRYAAFRRDFGADAV